MRIAAQTSPKAQTSHVYGPTENTTFACHYPIPTDLDGSIQSIPIGRPIHNSQFYILDRHFQLVPIGVPGELYIGGCGLARGYLNRPQLTEQRFVPNPSSSLLIYWTNGGERSPLQNG